MSDALDHLPRPQADWAYFFDVDGTLLNLAASPDAVSADDEVTMLIDQLVHRTGGAVALISGRTIADVDRLFPLHRLAVAGQHGGERRAASGAISSLRPLPADELATARDAVRALVQRHAGLLFEDKGASLALHYRGAPSLAAVAHLLFRSLQRKLGPAYCLQRGKFVVELRPAGADKGAALLAFMHEAPFEGRRPVFIGDDVTDEHGFAVTNALDGVSIKVGPGRTLARWRLADVAAVRRWLSRDVSAPSPQTMMEA